MCKPRLRSWRRFGEITWRRYWLTIHTHALAVLNGRDALEPSAQPMFLKLNVAAHYWAIVSFSEWRST